MTDATAAPSGAVTRASMVRVGAATAITALCGYAVLYLAARGLEPAGFSVFGVFWGAFGLASGAAFGLLLLGVVLMVIWRLGGHRRFFGRTREIVDPDVASGLKIGVAAVPEGTPGISAGEPAPSAHRDLFEYRGHFQRTTDLWRGYPNRIRTTRRDGGAWASSTKAS